MGTCLPVATSRHRLVAFLHDDQPLPALSPPLAERNKTGVNNAVATRCLDPIWPLALVSHCGRVQIRTVCSLTPLHSLPPPSPLPRFLGASPFPLFPLFSLFSRWYPPQAHTREATAQPCACATLAEPPPLSLATTWPSSPDPELLRISGAHHHE